MKREFKNIFKEILEDKHLSQSECAKLIKTSQSTISKWLAGVQEPRFFQLQNIAQILDIDPNFLLGLDD